MEDKDFAESLADYIFRYAVNWKTIQDFKEKEAVSMDSALSGAVQKKLTGLIDGHTSPETWLKFADLPERYRNDSALINAVFDIAIDGWRRGYIAGFSDRVTLG